MRNSIFLLFTLQMMFLVSCGQSPQAETSQLQDERDLVNFLKVNDVLYRSGNIKKADLPVLKRKGIYDILSLEVLADEQRRGEDEEAWTRDQGMKLSRVEMNGRDKPTIQEINAALAVIDATSNRPLLVHCFHGQDRTGIVIAAYRIRHDHWSVEDATKEMRRLGHARELYWWDDVLNEVR